jgi:hypothetical protein
MEGRCDDLELDVGHLASRRKGLLRPAMDGADTARGIPLVVRPPPLLVRALLG